MGLHSYGTDGRRLGGAGPLRPAARRAAGADQGPARGVRARRAAVLRLHQHPLHDGDPHRHLGDGQADPVLPAPPGRRADHVGLRLGRAPPPAVQPVAGRRAARAPASPPCAARSPRRPAAPRTSRARSASSSSSAACSASRSASTRSSRRSCSRCQAEGIEVVDGQQVILEARRIKTRDEIALLTQACVDGRRRLRGALRVPAARACARTSASAWSARCSTTWARSTSRASTPSRASAAPRTRTCYTDRALRPGDPAFFDILHSYMGYRTCYYRTLRGRQRVAGRSVDAYMRCRDYMDAAIALVKPGRHHRRRRAACGPRRRSSASPTRRPPSRCSTATASACRSGRSRSSAGWSRSTIPRRSARGHGLRAGDLLAAPATAGRRRGSRRSWW